VAACVHAIEREPARRCGLEAERAAGIGGDRAREHPFEIRLAGRREIDHCQRKRPLVVDHRHRAGVAASNPRAQDFVTADDLARGGGERRHRDGTFEFDLEHLVVQAAFRVQLVKEPEPFLCVRERRYCDS
jgi:hypothetical protein